jgi:4-hydroxy-tetrahydrodipicolinate synthase
MSHSAPRQGILAALWIPTDARGRLRKRALRAHLRWLRAQGVHGVLALGSTGEFPRFSLAEREAVLATIAELAEPMPVVANISDIRLDEVVALGKFARRLGVPAVALMPPSFFPMSQADMLEFFLRAADAVKLPVFLYNFPELTSNRIGLETVGAFADRADMAGIKQSGGEFAYHAPLIELGREKNFAVFSGADTRLPEVFALGAAGCIGGLVNFVPEFMVRIFDVCKRGAPGDCRKEAARMKEVGALVDRLTFPLNVACGLEARGFEPGAPKTVVSRQSAGLYRAVVADMRRHFRQWQLVPASSRRAATS